MPVLDDNGCVVGVVSDYDLLSLEGIAEQVLLLPLSCWLHEYMSYTMRTAAQPCHIVPCENCGTAMSHSAVCVSQLWLQWVWHKASCSCTGTGGHWHLPRAVHGVEHLSRSAAPHIEELWKDVRRPVPAGLSLSVHVHLTLGCYHHGLTRLARRRVHVPSFTGMSVFRLQRCRRHDRGAAGGSARDQHGSCR